MHCVFPKPDATSSLLICFEAGPGFGRAGRFPYMKIAALRSASARAAAALAFFALPAVSYAQQDPINGAISGAAQGTYQGKTAAGPVGGLVGGALGAGVGAVAGTLNVVGNGVSQVVQPVQVPPPPGSGAAGYYDNNGNWRPN
jgi:hypothetical protein